MTTTVRVDQVGSITLIDLLGICDVQGRDGLPYPFWRTQPVAVPEMNASSVAERFDSGDLRVFQSWVRAHAEADIWVECRVNFTSEDPDLRILAYRAGELGFFASQRPGEDVVDVFALSPYDLGAAIAGSVNLVAAGTHSEIVIPGYLDRFTSSVPIDEDDDDFELQVSSRVAPTRRREHVVSAGDVAVMTTVQSRCVPAREWGVDWCEKVAVCVRLRDDGDYLFTPDLERAVPVTAQALADRIDNLIAEDVAVLRRRRGLG
ncbi:hypothetical protein ACX9NE_16960 [Mycobacterium sp. ML4]